MSEPKADDKWQDWAFQQRKKLAECPPSFKPYPPPFQGAFYPLRAYPHVCPHCGRCPTCGRAGYSAYPPYGPWRGTTGAHSQWRDAPIGGGAIG